MSETITVTEARDNFPALVRRIAEQDDPVVVTSRNQPRVVLVPWETYQLQQTLQIEGAEHRLQMLVQNMLALMAALQEAYRSDSYELTQGSQELLALARQSWKTCRLLDTPRRHLSSTIADGLLFRMRIEESITVEQLVQLLQTVPLLQKTDLTQQEVAVADRALASVGIDAMMPLDDELVNRYGQTDI